MAKIESAIHSAIDKEISAQGHRDYLGASRLGEECERKLWYEYHMPKNSFAARTQMIFDFGHMIEEYAVKILKKAFTVYEVDENGEQFGFVDGPIAGHGDGYIEINGEVHLLEIKSMNKSRFGAVKKHGLKEKERTYWVQMQVYMQKIFPVKKGLYFAICKDNCEIYTEVIDLETGIADVYVGRGKEITASEHPFQRKYSKKSFFKCKMCDFAEECWNED